MMSDDAANKLKLAASLLLGAGICGACMVGMIAWWPALCASSCHGLLVTISALAGAAASVLACNATLDADAWLTLVAAVVGAALVVGLLAVPMFSVLYVLEAYVTAATWGLKVMSGVTFCNVLDTVSALITEGALLYVGTKFCCD